MSDKTFVDTNIAVYLYSIDEAEKQDVAEKIFETKPILSTQVLNEFINVLRKKFKLQPNDIELAVDELVGDIGHVASISLETIKLALAVTQTYKFSYYDSLIIASAIESGCGTLMSEDMSNGLVIFEKLTITNPFKK